MRIRTAAVSALVLLFMAGALSSKQEKKENTPPATQSKVPPEEAKRENPVKATPASIAEGKKAYTTQCAMCHGSDGDGKGDLATDMQLKLRDYRDPDALKDITDGELFYILSKGKGDMPGEEDRMKPDQRWNLINYIRSFAKKKAAGKEEKHK
jgi:mono/diheme cytochrome c family protein